MKLTPRPATTDDLEQVVAIEAYSNSPPWTKASFASEIDKIYSHFWVLTDDDTDEKIYAFIVFSKVDEQGHIQTLAVEKNSRRHGYAAYLVRAVIKFVLRNHGDSIVLEVRRSNHAALALYQQLGFVVIHTKKKHYPDGEDAYSMIYRFNEKNIANEEIEDVEEIEEDVGDDRSKKNFN